MTDEEINKAVYEFIFEASESQIFPLSFLKHCEGRQPVQRQINYIKDPSKIDYCNDVDGIRKAELWLMQEDELSHNKYMRKLFEIYNKGIKITTKHRAEEFVKVIGMWKENTI
jgi:hypothetical protein